MRHLEARRKSLGGGSLPLTRFRQRQAVAELAADGSPEAAALLADTAAHTPDRELQFLAVQGLARLRRLEAVDVVCALWAESRHPLLGALLRQQNWAASSQALPTVRLLTLLNCGRLAELNQSGPELAMALVSACGDTSAIDCYPGTRGAGAPASPRPAR
ncbi:MAG: hypothetical protein FJ315_08475 [SAR202 cluster bacterium]|nr:hypothetical protein [SAR202 cluster bacterium]